MLCYCVQLWLVSMMEADLYQGTRVMRKVMKYKVSQKKKVSQDCFLQQEH